MSNASQRTSAPWSEAASTANERRQPEDAKIHSGEPERGEPIMNFRLDRLVTLCLVRPLRRLASGDNLCVPILMYHSIADEDESAVRAYYRTATHPRVFAAQIAALREAGYSVISLREAMRRVEGGSPAIARSVAITFDDGYRNFYSDAFPILQYYGFTASVFLPTAYIGESCLRFKGKECLSWSEVRELQRHGICFGSHTVSHPQLYDLTAPAIREEVTVSKQTIEQKLGCAAESFAYPYAFPETDGEFKAQLRGLLCEAGYGYGVCTSLGRPHPGADPLFLKRLPVNSCDDESLFSAKLSGAYDWLAGPQRMVKWAKNRGSQRPCEG
jgi:peptidoglycan/xylan/chitin deacetylase (PgdA/CDA1 family)